MHHRHTGKQCRDDCTARPAARWTECPDPYRSPPMYKYLILADRYEEYPTYAFRFDAQILVATTKRHMPDHTASLWASCEIQAAV
jgi:hypothetical protein